ncbi:MAG: bifunctional metallophosphatase/5'-nucleotidase [Ignavibacteriaceae bacterium]|nr:bifunctional metallophosphatase/5'-nucleotidase [Ignavibacteriaceae bacterium]
MVHKIKPSVLLIFTLLISQLLSAQTINLKVIETSDVHGSLFPYDFIYDKAINTSLAQIYTYVKEERAKQDQQVVLLDDGDILQGQPVVYYYNFEKTDIPHICAQVMNYMKYDAGTVGNHDIEPGHAVYDMLNKEFNFPWLAANAVSEKTGQPYFKPYTIIKRGNVKIAVLGLITPAIPNWLPRDIWKGIEFKDMVETAQYWMKIINEKEKPDLVFGLFHSGAEDEMKSYKAGKTNLEDAARLVAELVPGFDVVFSGHDHQVWNTTVKGPDGKDVLILNPSNASRHAAVADIILNYDKQNNKWEKKIQGEIIDSKSYGADKAFMEKFTPVINTIKEYVAKSIGTFDKTISTRESFFGDSPFVDLIHSVQLDLTKADVSFADPLSFDAQIKKGTVYVRDMFKLYKYENLLYTMSLSGKEIKGFLEHSCSVWFNQMKSEDDHLLKFKADSTGNILPANERPQLASPYYNFSSAAGIKYTVDVSKPAGERVNIISMQNGKPFDLNTIYKVALSSYRGNGGGGHLTAGSKIPQKELEKRIINSTQKDLRFYLMKWIEEKKTVSPAAFNNWSIIPENYWLKGKEKDSAILFSEKNKVSDEK